MRSALRTVRVLVFVHHDEAELLRVLLPHALRLLEQVDGLQQEVVEIERVALLERLQVVLVDFRRLRVLLVPAARRRDRLGSFHPILRVADPRQCRARLDERIVDAQLLERLLDDRQLIGRVVDHEVARQTDGRRFAPEQPSAEGMKRRHPHPAAVGAEQMLDARAHLFRRFVCERDGEDFLRLRMAVADEMRDAAGDDARLARSGAGEDEKRPFDLQDRFALFRIERIEDVQSHHSTVTDFARLRADRRRSRDERRCRTREAGAAAT